HYRQPLPPKPPPQFLLFLCGKRADIDHPLFVRPQLVDLSFLLRGLSESLLRYHSAGIKHYYFCNLITEDHDSFPSNLPPQATLVVRTTPNPSCPRLRSTFGLQRKEAVKTGLFCDGHGHANWRLRRIPLGRFPHDDCHPRPAIHATTPRLLPLPLQQPLARLHPPPFILKPTTIPSEIPHTGAGRVGKPCRNWPTDWSLAAALAT
ncbi:hypothetical protein M406DRAFT_357595, partial [Cryphonectria parasitica EP155]